MTKRQPVYYELISLIWLKKTYDFYFFKKETNLAFTKE
jgi:hypothetical protein